MMVKSMGFGFKSQLQLLSAAWPWARYLTSLLNLQQPHRLLLRFNEKNTCLEELDWRTDLVNVNTTMLRRMGRGGRGEKRRAEVQASPSPPADQSQKSVHFSS